MQANYKNFFEIKNMKPELRKKISESFSRKTEDEQLIIFSTKEKIYSNVNVESKRESEDLKELKANKPALYDYIIFLLAIQMYNANATQKQYLTEVREARQQIIPKTISQARAIEVLLPLIDELKSTGAVWKDIAQLLSSKQKKILNNRKVSPAYLKKIYSQLKRQKK